MEDDITIRAKFASVFELENILTFNFEADEYFEEQILERLKAMLGDEYKTRRVYIRISKLKKMQKRKYLNLIDDHSEVKKRKQQIFNNINQYLNSINEDVSRIEVTKLDRIKRLINMKVLGKYKYINKIITKLKNGETLSLEEEDNFNFHIKIPEIYEKVFEKYNHIPNTKEFILNEIYEIPFLQINEQFLMHRLITLGKIESVDYYDYRHLTYLPYCDYFITDKRVK